VSHRRRYLLLDELLRQLRSVLHLVQRRTLDVDLVVQEPPRHSTGLRCRPPRRAALDAGEHRAFPPPPFLCELVLHNLSGVCVKA
jgi:hypothetical protein